MAHRFQEKYLLPTYRLIVAKVMPIAPQPNIAAIRFLENARAKSFWHMERHVPKRVSVQLVGAHGAFVPILKNAEATPTVVRISSAVSPYQAKANAKTCFQKARSAQKAFNALQGSVHGLNVNKEKP